jgi:uncharacterized protein (TIGR00251 family)
VRATPPALRLHIHVQPRAARTRIVGRHGDALKVQVHAPPVGGAANAALVELLADTLRLPRRAIRILRGTSGREKLVEVDCRDQTACLRQLQTVLQACVDKEKGRS